MKKLAGRFLSNGNAEGPTSFDVLIVGGGVTGAALGYGLAKNGTRVAVLDEVPSVDRSSRSNMGLIWCQSKALGIPGYVRWGFSSSKLYKAFAKELFETSGIDMEYTESGGIIPCLGNEEFTRRSDYMDGLREEAGGEYPGSMVNRAELEKLLPKIKFGKEVVGGTWCPEDGLVEPLKLLFALRQGMVNMGGTLYGDCRALSTRKVNDGYRVKTTRGVMECKRLVLAGGLGNRQLAAPMGLKVPVTPDRGQVFLTERVDDILPTPILGITRTPGGTVMVGFMHENVGTDIGFTPESVAKEARWAVSVWPALANLRVIRCWSSLRVMPRDGFPIYDRVPGHENAFVINAHSSVTLAAVHARELPDYILGGPLPEDAKGFTLARFQET